jgi:hypothetical protein
MTKENNLKILNDKEKNKMIIVLTQKIALFTKRLLLYV